jgi:hypothetical protein
MDRIRKEKDQMIAQEKESSERRHEMEQARHRMELERAKIEWEIKQMHANQTREDKSETASGWCKIIVGTAGAMLSLAIAEDDPQGAVSLTSFSSATVLEGAAEIINS